MVVRIHVVGCRCTKFTPLFAWKARIMLLNLLIPCDKWKRKELENYDPYLGFTYIGLFGHLESKNLLDFA